MTGDERSRYFQQLSVAEQVKERGGCWGQGERPVADVDSRPPLWGKNTLFGSRCPGDQRCSKLGSAAYGVLQVRQKECWPLLYGSNMALSVSFEVHVWV